MLGSIDLDKIPVFLSVAKHLSFSEASYELYTTQSSISKAIAALEFSLGFPLFIRKNRKITLTPAGNFLYKELSKAMQDIDQIILDARKIQEGKNGSFSIGFSGYLAKTPKFVQICSAFSMEYPEFEFELKLFPYQDLKKSLAEEAVAAILFHSSDMSSMPSTRFLLLMSSEPVLICNPYTITEKDTSIKNFTDAKFISVHPTYVPQYQQYLIDCCKSHGFTPTIAKYTNSIFELIQHLSNSDYVTIMDRSIFPIPAEDLRLIPISQEPDSPVVDTILAWSKTNGNPVLARFISSAAKDLVIHG